MANKKPQHRVSEKKLEDLTYKINPQLFTLGLTPHYHHYLAYGTQEADGHRHQIGHYRFSIVGVKDNYTLDVGTQTAEDSEHRTIIRLRQVHPQDEAKTILDLDKLPTLKRIKQQDSLLVRMSLKLSRDVIHNIEKNCITK